MLQRRTVVLLCGFSACASCVLSGASTIVSYNTVGACGGGYRISSAGRPFDDTEACNASCRVRTIIFYACRARMIAISFECLFP